MQYVYQFDVAALLLTVLLFLIYVINGGYPTRTRTVFIELMTCTIVAAVFDVVSVFTIENPSVPDWLNSLIKGVFLIADNFCVQFFFLYVLSISTDGKKSRVSSRVNRLIGVAMMAIIVLLIGTSPFTHWIFHFENGRYYRDAAYYTLYAITAFAMVYSAVIFIKYRSFLSKFQIVSVIGFLIGVVAMVVIQVAFSNLRLTVFACSLGTVLLYASLERPSDYIYKNTHCYNKTAFFDYIKEHSGEKFYVVIVNHKNADYLGRTLSLDTWDGAIKVIINDLHTEFGRKRVFHIDGMCFAVITKEDPVKDVVARSINLSSDSVREMSDFHFTILPFPELAVDMNKMRETVDVIVHYPNKHSDNVFWFTAEELGKLDREILVLNAVRKAVRDEKLQVYYQPILETVSGRFVSAEALIRLKDDELGYISPEEFIPIAEQNGLIVSIGEFVFDSVCKFWCDNNLSDLGVSFIEVNLSTLQCMQQNLSARLVRIMKKHGVDTRCINLEITETAAASNRTVMLSNMEKLIGIGAAFSLDDYGSGYSNIDYLTTLPIEIVKIDKSILWKAMENDNSRTILVHTLRMIRELGLKTVAEGVETQEMVDLLKTAGCDYYQGFLYSRPLPSEEYLEFLKKNLKN